MSTSGQHPSSSSRDLTLVVESESGTHSEHYVRVSLSIGRANSNPIHIDHPDVDHIHAKVEKRGEAFWLRCGSQAKLKVLDPEPGEVGEVELTTGLTIELGGVILRCGQQMKGMGSLSDDYWADAAGGERFRVESDSFRGDLPKKIGPYEIQKFVARGGMGIVLQGVHEATGRWVAVKLPLAKFNADLQLLQRFEKEINTLKALKHPNIVGLEDEGKEGQLYWMAMEWVEGPSVKEWREGWTKDNKQVPLNQIWVFVSQMVQGLEYLHSQEVVHRDLKPANIMVETRGEETVVKVADFGLAKQVGGEQSTGLTGTGHMPGTFHYMAPEQLDGLDITAATDVYALGLIAHELLTGKRPGRGKLKLDKLRPDCPEQIRELVARCLEDEPEDRPSLHEIENALGPLVSETEKKQAEALRIERLQQKAAQRGEELRRQQEAEGQAVKNTPPPEARPMRPVTSPPSLFKSFLYLCLFVVFPCGLAVALPFVPDWIYRIRGGFDLLYSDQYGISSFLVFLFVVFVAVLIAAVIEDIFDLGSTFMGFVWSFDIAYILIVIYCFIQNTPFIELFD